MITSEGKLSVLLATYNEEGNICQAIESIKKALPAAQIIVADDGSQDSTVEQAMRFEDRSVKVLSLTHSGKGNAIRWAIQEASGEVMAQIDADLQFPAEGLTELIVPILKDEADIVFGSRYLDRSSIEKGSVGLMKRLASYFIAILMSAFCNRRYTDVFAGFKAWKSQAIKDINIQEKGFAYEAEIAIKASRCGYRVIEIPTGYKRRISGQSKIRFLYHAPEIFWRIIYLIFFAK